MEHIEKAILRTLLYADVFRFPMTTAEIHRYLIHDSEVPLEAIQQTLNTSPRLKKLLRHENGYIALAQSAENINLRLQREKIVRVNFPDALRYGIILSYLPFVEMVAMTGALAVRNPTHEHDDYDYLLITRPGRVWLARAFAILIVRVTRRWGKNLCPNYVLAGDNLLQQQQNLYMAHEVAQMVPIYGQTMYWRMQTKNQWICAYLPNAYPLTIPTRQIKQNRIGRFVKNTAERLLCGKFGDVLENWEYRRKARLFQEQAQQPASSAQIDQSHVKGHFQDHGNPVLNRYYQKLREYQIEEEIPLPIAGD